MLTWTVGTVGALWAVGRVEQLEEFNATTLVYWRADSLQKKFETFYVLRATVSPPAKLRSS
jgi:hypothetical protein